MKIYKIQKQVEEDIKNGVLAIDDDVEFECDISIEASINARDIKARDINAWDIKARNINAGNINARDINAGDINAWDIKAGNINAWNIKARDINAWDIKARNIKARDISYHAFCCAYQSIKCNSIQGRRENHHEPICLDGKIEIKSENPEEIVIDGATYILKKNI